MKTDEILAQIDACLDDDESWPDAMRVAPRWDEPVIAPPATLVELRMLEGWDGYAASEAARAWPAQSPWAGVSVLLVADASRLMLAFGEAVKAFVAVALRVREQLGRWTVHIPEADWQPGDREDPKRSAMHAAYNQRRRKRR